MWMTLMKSKKNKAVLVLLLLSGLSFAQTSYRIRMASSSYTAQLRGVTGTRTAGEVLQGTYITSYRMHEFQVTKSGPYKLYYDPAGGSSYIQDATFDGAGVSDGKIILGEDWMTYFWDRLNSGDWTATSAFLGDTSVTSTALKDSIVALYNLTTAAYNFIGAGGEVTNNPDDVTLENKGGDTIGIKAAGVYGTALATSAKDTVKAVIDRHNDEMDRWQMASKPSFWIRSGTGGYSFSTSDSAVNITDRFTMIALVEGLNAVYCPLLHKGTGTPNVEWTWGLNNYRQSFRFSPDGTDTIIDTIGYPKTTTAHCAYLEPAWIALTFDEGDWATYVNGELDTSGTANYTAMYDSVTSRLQVGMDSDFGGYFYGMWNNISMYNMPLSADQIKFVHAGGGVPDWLHHGSCVSIVTDGDCESAGWTPQDDPENGVVTYPGAQAHGGSNAMHFVASGGAGVSYVFFGEDSSRNGFIPGQRYRAECWVYIPSGGIDPDSVEIQSWWARNVVQIPAQTSNTASTTDTWEKLYLEFYTCATSNHHNLRISFGNGVSFGDDLYVDDLKVFPIGEVFEVTAEAMTSDSLPNIRGHGDAPPAARSGSSVYRTIKSPRRNYIRAMEPHPDEAVVWWESIIDSVDVPFFSMNSKGLMNLMSAYAGHPRLRLSNTEAGNTAPRIIFDRHSASPADDDAVGQLSNFAQDDGDEEEEITRERWFLEDASDGHTAGEKQVQIMVDDTLRTFMRLDGMEAGVGQAQIDFNVEKIDMDILFHGSGFDTTLYMDGVEKRVAVGGTPKAADFSVIDGSAYSAIDAGDAAWTASSDSSLKNKIKPLPILTEKFLQVSPVTYCYKKMAFLRDFDWNYWDRLVDRQYVIDQIPDEKKKDYGKWKKQILENGKKIKIYILYDWAYAELKNRIISREERKFVLRNSLHAAEASAKVRWGFLAQEFNGAFNGNPDGTSINFNQVMAIQWKVTQELIEKIRSQEKKIEDLERRIQALEELLQQ